jgi:hypothetical protein
MLLATVLGGSASSAALANTGDAAAFVRAHIERIAAADPGPLASDYLPDAFLWWVGGPLNGAYSGGTIEATWKKFAAQGKFDADVESLSEAANPAGATFVADVTYKGEKATLRVREVFLVRGDKLEDEIWQIAPKGPTTLRP